MFPVLGLGVYAHAFQQESRWPLRPRSHRMPATWEKLETWLAGFHVDKTGRSSRNYHGRQWELTSTIKAHGRHGRDPRWRVDHETGIGQPSSPITPPDRSRCPSVMFGDGKPLVARHSYHLFVPPHSHGFVASQAETR